MTDTSDGADSPPLGRPSFPLVWSRRRRRSGRSVRPLLLKWQKSHGPLRYRSGPSSMSNLSMDAPSGADNSLLKSHVAHPVHRETRPRDALRAQNRSHSPADLPAHRDRRGHGRGLHCVARGALPRARRIDTKAPQIGVEGAHPRPHLTLTGLIDEGVRDRTRSRCSTQWGASWG